MKLVIDSQLYYQVYGPTTFLFSVSCSRLGGQTILEESISTHPEIPSLEMELGLIGNRFHKCRLETPGELSLYYHAVVETGLETTPVGSLPFQTIDDLGGDTIPFLFPSRYVPSDRMRTAAADLFGHIEGPYDIATAVETWLFENISYQAGSSFEHSTAANTFIDRVGVCRDFAHLGIAFCRALNVPARYATVYSLELDPQDFHAVFEVWIGGEWYLVDGTRKAPLNGLVKIASGRDAGDVAAAMLFGNVMGSGVQVQVSPAEGENPFEPLTRADLTERALATRFSSPSEEP